MRKRLSAAALAVLMSACAPPSDPSSSASTGLNQGWTAVDRAAFYRLDQGSQIMPAAWMANLKAKDGQPFLADRLARYGYLKNEADPLSPLPVGFTNAVARSGEAMVGMTCAACHTREIKVGPRTLRIDGGPAFADFQSFVADLDDAVAQVLKTPAAFQAFAAGVLGPQASPASAAALQRQVQEWYARYHLLMSRSLPRDNPWGPARLDAISMIFNRLTGLDIGPTAKSTLPENIRRADVPARYPFLWNAAIQDKTQWPGFAPNGNALFGLSRNLGEVYGVFAAFHPAVDPKRPSGMNYLAENSANFPGLLAAEDYVRKLKPPANPWAAETDAATAARVARGKALFEETRDGASCVGCHGIVTVPNKLLPSLTNWKTPIVDVGTDTRQVQLLDRCATAGTLAQAKYAILKPKPVDSAINILTAAVLNSIAQKVEENPGAAVHVVLRDLGMRPNPKGASVHRGNWVMESAALSRPAGDADHCANGPHTNPSVPRTAPYAARVLEGIWAAAPYLHNGSVPTLADLLTPAEQRPASFAVGDEYDPVRVGLARTQPRSAFVLHTTGCADRNSGNSRCGHDYGTRLSPEDKQALLEFLKRL